MKLIRSKVLLLLLLSVSSIVVAQGKYPDGPIKLIVPFAPGGGVDSAARLIAKQMQTILSSNIIVENRPGANGSIGGKAVQLSNPDG